MISEAEAISYLSPYSSRITKVIMAAWQDWQASGKSAVWKYKRSRATYVWEEITNRMLTEFANEPCIRIHPQNQTCYFCMEHLVFRIKKSDANGLTRNYPTQAALDYHDPEGSPPLLPELPRLEITYVLNTTETRVQDVFLVSRERETVVWCTSLLRNDAADSNVTTITPPIRPLPSDQPERTIKIAVKSPPKKAAENDS